MHEDETERGPGPGIGGEDTPPPSQDEPSRLTRWTMIRAASAGDAEARDLFVQQHESLVRRTLQHRWRHTPRLLGDLDDAVQEVFVECVKPGGVLERSSTARDGFRKFLYGVVRNVARRHEDRRAADLARRPDGSVYLDALPDEELTLSRWFDRNWARSVLDEARERHRDATSGDADAQRRFEILRLRHEGGLPIRAVAEQLGIEDVDAVHNAYRRARREYRAHLNVVVSARTGAVGDAVEIECRRLTELLGG